jgi:V8-like Glu-specific endopeptidase
MSALKRSFLTVGSLIAVAAVMQANAPAAAQVALFDPGNYGAANLARRQSASDADDFITKSGGAFEPISALRADDEIRKVARSIGRVDVVLREDDGREVMATCTGTLLPHGQVLTNHHCIPVTGPRKPVRASILMNYLELDGRDARRFDLSVTPTESNDKLDFSIVPVQGNTAEFEGIRLSAAGVQPGQSLVVIHHPQGRPMVMTRFRCQAYSDQPDQSALRHRCDTLPGSSGAMIFTSGLLGVALHFAGGLERGDERSFNLSTRVTALAGASQAIRQSLTSKDETIARESRPVENRPAENRPVESRQEEKQSGGVKGGLDPNAIIKEMGPR